MEVNTILVTEIEMINTIKPLNTKKSSGYAGMSNKILKCSAN
jgi:hypothetical protein